MNTLYNLTRRLVEHFQDSLDVWIGIINRQAVNDLGTVSEVVYLHQILAVK